MQAVNETAIQTIQTQARRQKRNALIVKWMVRLLMTLCFIVLPLWTLYLLIGGIGPLMFSATPSYIYPIILVLVYGAFFIVPLLICLPIVLAFAIRHRNTSRIVVLRKFNKHETNVLLRRIIRTILANYGHVFTLSDKGFRIRWYVRIPVILGQMSFFHFRQRTIEKPTQLARLQQVMEQKVWLNINWLFSANKVFSVKTTDACWQETVIALLKNSGLIVFDVSEFTASQEWETETIISLNMQHRMIVLAAEEQRQSAQAWKERFDQPDDYDIPMFFYDPMGRLADEAAFEACIASNLAQQPQQQGSVWIRELYSIQSVRIAGVVMAFFLVVLFLLSPIILPDLAGRYSPFPRQVVQAYTQSLMHNSNDELSIPILNRIRKLWPRQGAELSIHNAYHHEFAECRETAIVLKDLAHSSKTADYIMLIKKGDPAMASAAFDILKELRPSNVTDIALDLISQQRIDVRERALELFQQTTLDSIVVHRLVRQLNDEQVPITDPILPHQRKASGLFNRSFEDRLVLHQLGLYRMLSSYMPTIESALPALKNDHSASNDFGITRSLLLLEKNNGSGIEALLNQRFLTVYYPSYFHSLDGIFSFGQRMPFQEITDSLLLRKERIGHLPPYANLTDRRSQWSAVTRLPKSMAHFLVQNYSKQALADFSPYIESKAMADLLYEQIKGGSPHDLPFYDSLILANRDSLNGRLQQPYDEINDHLNIAWLLARVGDAGGLETAVRASRITKGLFFWKRHPYEEQAAQVLTQLIKNAGEPYDKASLIRMKDSLSTKMTGLMDQLIRKSR